jgi:SAM-dependent methyltransferase
MEATEVRKLAALEDRHWWYAERRTILRRMVTANGHTRRHDMRAIDIGAAGGGNTRVLRDLGLFAVPVEHGTDGASLARGRGLPAVRADARRLPFSDGCLDLAVAFDVLEHIEEDVSALHEIRRVLKPGGRVLIAVPADMSLWSAHDEAVGHVRRYSRESLVAAVHSSGLVVDQVRSWNVLLRPAVAHRRKSAAGSDLDEVGEALNRLLYGIVALERLIPVCGRFPGVSLLLQGSREH